MRLKRIEKRELWVNICVVQHREFKQTTLKNVLG